MEVAQKLRKITFWIVDFLKGNQIKPHYQEIESILKNSDIFLVSKLQEDIVQKLLKHAIESCPYYSSIKNFESIQNFPVIDKNLIRDNFESFLSNKFLTKDRIKVSTSGSTGAPFSVFQDKNKRNRSIADTLVISQFAGYEIGQKLFYFKIWPDKITSKKIRYGLKKKNIQPVSVFKLKDEDLEKLIEELKKDILPKSFLGYPSAFKQICKFLDRKNSPIIQSNIKSIITMSEGLDPYTRNSLEKYFGVAPISRYSNNENGIIAQENPNDRGHFQINSASFFIEIFDLEKDIPLAFGKLGRIVVTDLFNYAMPLIRYDTGDIGIMKVDKEGKQYLESIEGRKLDMIYDTKGDLVPSHISYKLCKYGDYKQFQLIQYGAKSYMIKLNTDKKVEEDQMKTEYQNYLGKDAKIDIVYVDEIPLLASGKRREVTNTYHSQMS